MKRPQNKVIKTLNRIFSWVLPVLAVILIAFICYFIFCNISGRVAFIGKYAAVKIITPSMEPVIPAGTYIISEKVDAASVKEGDVIMFYSRDPAIYGKINTHRVVKIIDDGTSLSFVTRGDNNKADDAYPVSEKDLVGRYVRNADKLTVFAGFFSNPFVFFLAVIIPAALLIVFSVLDIIKRSKEVRMEKLIEEEVKRLQEEDNNKEKEPTDDV
ncbi:MAG: signal peptidase I [Eubacteriales bacterium]